MASGASDEVQKHLQVLSDDYQKLQQSLTELVSAQQKLSSQQQENQSVQREFATLPDQSQIYKMVGPVLLKQERGEANMAVEGRLDYIGKELRRVEDQISDTQGKSESKKMEIFQLQTQAQQAQEQAAA